MLFEFENEEDKDHIFFYKLEWVIQGHCLSLHKWESSVGFTAFKFTKIQF